VTTAARARGVLRLMLVAIGANGHRRDEIVVLAGFRQLEVAAAAVLPDPLDVRSMGHLQALAALREGPSELHVAVAEGAIPLLLLLLVALEALSLLGQLNRLERLGVVDVFVTGDAFDFRCRVPLMRETHLISPRALIPLERDGGAGDHQQHSASD